MANKQETIIIKAELEKENLTKNASQSLQDIERLKQAMKDLKAEGKGNTEEFVKLDTQLKNSQKEYRSLTSILQSNIEANKAANGSYKQLTATLKQEEEQLKRLEGTLSRNEKGELELTEVYKNQSKVVEELKRKQIEFDQQINVGSSNVGNYANTISGMKQRLEQMKIELNGLEVGSVAFVEMKDKIDKLSTSVQIAEGKIDSMGQKVAKNSIKDNFNDALGATQALTGGLAILSLTMDQESESAEIVRKVLIGVTIAQTALTIAQQKDDIVKIKNVVTTKLATAAQWAYNNALKAAAAVGIAGAVIGLGIWVSKLFKSKEVVEDTTTAQDKLNASMQKTNQIIQDIKDQFDNPFESSVQGQIDALNELNEIRKANGATEEELIKRRIAIANLEIQKVNETEKAIEESGAANQLTTIEMEKRLSALRVELAKANAELKNIVFESQKTFALSSIPIFDVNGIRTSEEEAINYLKNTAIPAFLDAMGISEEEQQKIQDDIANPQLKGMSIAHEAAIKLNNDKDQLRKADAENELKHQEELISIFQDFSNSISGVVQSSFDETGFQIEKFAQSFVLLMLDTLEKVTLISIGEATGLSLASPESVATAGIAGVAKAAIIAGLIKAAFAAVKGAISSSNNGGFFEEGGGFEIGGKRHSQGGTKFIGSDGSNFEAEQGELLFILNRNASDHLKNLMQFNKAFAPNVDYSKSSSFLASGGFPDGGFSARQLSRTVTTDAQTEMMMRRIMRETLSELPAPILKITELNRVQGGVNNTTTVSTL